MFFLFFFKKRLTDRRANKSYGEVKWSHSIRLVQSFCIDLFSSNFYENLFQHIWFWFFIFVGFVLMVSFCSLGSKFLY